MFGNIIKVIPSSKVVGDMDMFMTSNNLSKEDIIKKGSSLSFPESVRAFFRGDLGQPYEGFPKDLQEKVLGEVKPYDKRPNSYLDPIDLDAEYEAFKEKYGPYVTYHEFLARQLYPKIFEDNYNHYEKYRLVRVLSSLNFYFWLKEGEEMVVELDQGKDWMRDSVSKTNPN